VVDGFNTYFVKDHTTCKTKYTEDDIVNMINFLIDKIFIEYGDRIFQKLSAFLWELTLLPICFNNHTKPSLSKTLFLKEKRN